ncbi:hypothetical protein ABBQ32_001023 [Trebouxia sp. C0010 RCD-2024]
MQRRLHNRKVAQKRFRQREKERKSFVQTELEHTQRELHQSKTYQATLEAELDMLKGLAHTSHNSHQLLSPQHEPAWQSSHKRRDAFGLPEHVTRLIESSVTTVTSSSHACCTCSTVKELPIAEMKKLYQDALSYTPGQIADLLVMRQLFFTKLGHLQRARTKALYALSACSHDLHQTKDLTGQMQALVEEQYHALLQFGAACLFGVHTARQLAMGIVQSFPQLFFCHQLLDALGERHGAPSKQSLMSLCVPEIDNVSWNDVISYLQGITCHTVKDYLPFLMDDAPHVLRNTSDQAAR